MRRIDALEANHVANICFPMEGEGRGEAGPRCGIHVVDGQAAPLDAVMSKEWRFAADAAREDLTGAPPSRAALTFLIDKNPTRRLLTGPITPV